MKRKVYTTDRERKSDQVIGCVAFPIVNVALWLAMSRLLAEATTDQARARALLLPWIVNGLVLILAFLFRPQTGVGYIAWIGLACVPMVACSPCLAACFHVNVIDWVRNGPGDPLFLVLALGAALEVSLLFVLGIVALFDRRPSDM